MRTPATHVVGARWGRPKTSISPTFGRRHPASTRMRNRPPKSPGSTRRPPSWLDVASARPRDPRSRAAALPRLHRDWRSPGQDRDVRLPRHSDHPRQYQDDLTKHAYEMLTGSDDAVKSTRL